MSVSEKLNEIHIFLKDQKNIHESYLEVQKDQTAAIVRLESVCGRLVTIVEGDPKAGVDGYGIRIKKLEKSKLNGKIWRIAESVGLAGLLAWFGLS